MIRIHRATATPAILGGKGKAATSAIQAEYDAGKRDFKSKDFKKSIYGAREVKAALRKAQHEKCAFCESRVSHVSPGDVEHYRPKAEVAQADGAPKQRPAYYWLAYEWSNLLFCCPLCNQSFKRGLFPLRRPSRRALCHHDDLSEEEPLLINPTAVDPAAFIGFRAEVAYPIRGRREGRTTIAALGLNRVELLEKRRDRLAELAALREARDLFRQRQRTGGLSAEEQAALTRFERLVMLATAPEAEYSAMARALFA